MVSKPDFNPNTPYEDYENFQGEEEFEIVHSLAKWKREALGKYDDIAKDYLGLMVPTEKDLKEDECKLACYNARNFGWLCN